jgi:uridine monophosphate synthetase
MTTSFFSRLERRARQIDSLLCVGLDPHPQDLPSPTPQAAHAYCLRLIEATYEFALAFKPNSAFFEVFGPAGIEALQQVIAAVPEQIPVVLDAKRGDIASTAEAYARTAFQLLGADAITASPYLGKDSLEPFLESPEHGVFLLCKTSNPGSADLQDRTLIGGETVYEAVARLAREWNQKDNLGLVVGATHPEALRQVRRLAPQTWMLAPGVGAQGGDLEKALQAGLRLDGSGMLVTVSRALARATNPRQAAQGFMTQMRLAIENSYSTQSRVIDDRLAILADGLLEAGCVKFGQFTLKSGLVSPIYLDLRLLTGYPELLGRVASAYQAILTRLRFERLAALPYAALPIATAISLQGAWPLIYPRKESKPYGTKAEIEGGYHPGELVAVIDDLATTGGSKFEAIEKLTFAGLQVKDIVVLIDRQSGAKAALAQAGYELHSVFTLSALLDHWQANGKVPADKLAETRAFISQGS